MWRRSPETAQGEIMRRRKRIQLGRKDEERAGGVEVTEERKRETHTPENENLTPVSPCFPAKPVKNPGLSLKLTSNNFQRNQY